MRVLPTNRRAPHLHCDYGCVNLIQTNFSDSRNSLPLVNLASVVAIAVNPVRRA